MENRIKLKVLGLTYSQVKKGAYALVLAEEEGPRRIPVVIGVSEAQSIAISLEGIIPPRPITHDLFVSFAHGFGIRLKEVCIYKLENGVFYSEMVFDDGTREMRDLSACSRKELKERLEKAIASEAYEEAARIQEELNKRDNRL